MELLSREEAAEYCTQSKPKETDSNLEAEP